MMLDMTTSKFSRGDRIYPNLAALDESTPGHTWGMARKGQGWCSKEERVSVPWTVVRFMRGGSNGLGEPKYEMALVDGRRSQYDQGWVEKNFRSEAEHVDYLLTVAMSPFDTVGRVTARNALMDIGNVLCKEVCAYGDFEDLLSAWTKHQYRPTLSVRIPAAKLLADIYDAVQAVRGISVVAFRSHG